MTSIDDLNHIIGDSDAVSVQDILEAPPRQRILPSKIEDQQLRILFDLASSLAQRARLLSVSSPHASAWLSVMPHPSSTYTWSRPNSRCMALKWWLGMDTSQNARCSLCPSHALDPLGHHALTCKRGGDLIVRYNALRDTFWESYKLACVGGQLEAGSLDEEGRQTRPANIQVQNWEFGKPARQHWISTSHHR